MQTVLLCLLLAGTVLDPNSIIPGKFIIEPTTLICAGFEWYVDGDDNHNASATVHYREKGSREWKKALPLLRIGHEKAGYQEWNFVTPNMFAGSSDISFSQLSVNY